MGTRPPVMTPLRFVRKTILFLRFKKKEPRGSSIVKVWEMKGFDRGVERRLWVRRWNEVKKSHNLQPVFLFLLQASRLTLNVEFRGHALPLPLPLTYIYFFLPCSFAASSLQEFVGSLNSPDTSEQREQRCMSMTALRLMTLGEKERRWGVQDMLQRQ